MNLSRLAVRAIFPLVVLTSQPAQITTMTYDGMGNQLTCDYPSGRIIVKTYDTLERLSTLSDAVGGVLSNIVDYSYVGPGRVEGSLTGHGVATQILYDGLTTWQERVEAEDQYDR